MSKKSNKISVVFANTTLILGILFSCIFFIYIINQLLNENINLDYNFNLYLIIFNSILFIFFISCFKFSINKKTNICIILITTIFTLYALEIYLNTFTFLGKKETESIRYEKAMIQGIDYDKRKK